MKISHRIPWATLTSDPMDDDYARRVEETTLAGERAYAAAARRLAKAEARYERVQIEAARRPSKGIERDLAEAWAVVELRRIELDGYARMAAASVQPAKNRGRKSYRPVPITHGAA